MVHGLCCSVVCGMFPDQGSTPALAGRFFTTESPGKPALPGVTEQLATNCLTHGSICQHYSFNSFHLTLPQLRPQVMFLSSLFTAAAAAKSRQPLHYIMGIVELSFPLPSPSLPAQFHVL